jgi:twinkle protein
MSAKINEQLEKEIIENQKNIDDVSSQVKIREYWAKYLGEDRVERISSEIERLKDRVQRHSFESGITSLDKLIGGFKSGQLVVVSAPTGQGKTSFCQTLTSNITKSGEKCLWFTYEVPITEFAEKFGDDIPEFYVPRKLKESSLDWICVRILEGISKYGTNVIFIDHLHFLIDMEMISRTSTSLSIGSMVRKLKKFALDYGLTIFLIAHMKKIKFEENENPDIDDIRDSSFISQEADTVLMMKRHRKKMNGDYIFDNQAKLLVVKNRDNGKLGVVNLIYDANNKFVEIDLIHESEY